MTLLFLDQLEEQLAAHNPLRALSTRGLAHWDCSARHEPHSSTVMKDCAVVQLLGSKYRRRNAAICGFFLYGGGGRRYRATVSP
jgi:hypothetical protein